MNPHDRRKIRPEGIDGTKRTRINGIWLSLILVIFLYSVLFIRLSYIQIFKAAEYAEEALAQRVKPSAVEPVRGRILDRNGTELAYSTTSNSIYVRPEDLKDTAATAAKLAPILGIDKNKLAEQIKLGQKPSIIARKVSYEALQTIATQRISGLDHHTAGAAFLSKGKPGRAADWLCRKRQPGA